MKARYVFISAPFTSNPAHNIHDVIEVADKLIDRGFIPFIPHLYITYDMVSPKHYECFMQLCVAWLLKCDAVIRLPGGSPGADREVLWAEEHKIPVFSSLQEFFHAARG